MGNRKANLLLLPGSRTWCFSQSSLLDYQHWHNLLVDSEDTASVVDQLHTASLASQHNGKGPFATKCTKRFLSGNIGDEKAERQIKERERQERQR